MTMLLLIISSLVLMSSANLSQNLSSSVEEKRNAIAAEGVCCATKAQIKNKNKTFIHSSIPFINAFLSPIPLSLSTLPDDRHSKE